ncbi:MAG TPA: patatin-like phospholipase family protein [Anaerolineaceae bacterium]|nr:patatin-like phospholipase family protein [Anaerolineaceae bacterium]
MDSIVLALGGGGVRGIAHIGVIRRLEQAGFHIAAVAGTSVGAIVGSLYAAGLKSDRIADLVTHVGTRDFFSRDPDDGPSLMGLAGLKRVLEHKIGKMTFADLAIPFACTAVDIKSDQEVILYQGSLMESVQASAALPGIFPTVKIGEYELVDGGVLDPVPVSLARWLAPGQPVVAVCLHPVPEHWAEMPAMPFAAPSTIPQPILNQVNRLRIAQAFKIFARSMDITSRMLAELHLQIDKPDVIIRPDVGEFGLLDNVEGDELIQRGELAASEKIEEIRRAFQLKNRVARIFQHPKPPGMVFDPDDLNGHSSD